MRNAILLAFLVSCATPVPTPVVVVDPPTIITEEGVPIYVKNSLWETVKTDVLERKLGRAIESATFLQSELDAYNSTHTDDLLRMYENEAPGIEDSPPVDVFICHPVTYEVNMAQYAIARVLLVENADGWRLDAYGQVLFIDHVPPAPIIIPPASYYAHYALYVVDGDGLIKFEDHCGYHADESFDGEWITDPSQGGWASIDAYFVTTRNAFAGELNGIGRESWRLIERQVYNEP